MAADQTNLSDFRQLSYFVTVSLYWFFDSHRTICDCVIVIHHIPDDMFRPGISAVIAAGRTVVEVCSLQ